MSYVSPAVEALRETALALRAAGREEDAAVIDRALELEAEVEQWAACLRCSLAFPTAGQLSVHYGRAH